MALELDTFLVAVYVIVDDLYQAQAAPQKPCRPGPPPTVSDSEVLTLVVCRHWLGYSERAMGRYAAAHWHDYFPRQLSQSAFNRRARDLSGVLVALVPLVAGELGAALRPYQVLDGLPLPLARRCRGQYHRLFADEAGIGRGGSDRAWYFGCQLWVAVTDEGVITGFVLAPASCEGRWVAEAFLCWRHDRLAEPWGADDIPAAQRWYKRYRGPTGPIWPRAGVGLLSVVPYLADDGLAGAAWTPHWQADYGAMVLTKRALGAATAVPAARQQHCGWRQIVETVGHTLTDVFDLAFPRAKTRWGLVTQVAAKLLAFNLGIWLNRHFDRNDLAMATLIV
jgi:hypothetical protein